MGQNNTTNSGKWLENLLGDIHEAYRVNGRAKIEKVFPPVRVVNRRAFIVKNTDWLDFLGTWTERQGLMVHLEAKSTTGKESLRINDEGAITTKQMDALSQWHFYGAAVAVLWGRVELGEVRLVSFQDLASKVAANVLNIKWSEADISLGSDVS